MLAMPQLGMFLVQFSFCVSYRSQFVHLVELQVTFSPHMLSYQKLVYWLVSKIYTPALLANDILYQRQDYKDTSRLEFYMLFCRPRVRHLTAWINLSLLGLPSFSISFWFSDFKSQLVHFFEDGKQWQLYVSLNILWEGLQKIDCKSENLNH